jgi:hypothetical protein
VLAPACLRTQGLAGSRVLPLRRGGSGANDSSPAALVMSEGYVPKYHECMALLTPSSCIAVYLRCSRPGAGTTWVVATSCEQPTCSFAEARAPWDTAACAQPRKRSLGPA